MQMLESLFIRMGYMSGEGTDVSTLWTTENLHLDRFKTDDRG